MCDIGPGALSRALLSLPRSKVEKLIILESEELYLKYLRVRTRRSLVTRSFVHPTGKC